MKVQEYIYLKKTQFDLDPYIAKEKQLYRNMQNRQNDVSYALIREENQNQNPDSAYQEIDIESLRQSYEQAKLEHEIFLNSEIPEEFKAMNIKML